MKIETPRDKIVLTEDEVQDLVKDYILTHTGRAVDGAVNFQLRPGSSQLCTVYAHLKDDRSPVDGVIE